MATLADEQTQLAIDTADYFWANPEEFNRDVLRRPRPTSYQLDVWHSVRDNRHTNWRSGHMVGKDWTAAGIMLWFLYCRPPCIVLSTGPTNVQLEDVLWGEVRKAWRNAQKSTLGQLRLFGRLGMRPQRITMDDDWYCLGLSPDDVEAFSGRHAGDVLVCVDEASGVKDPELWKAMASQLNGPNARMLTLGNPLEPDGEFYQRHVRQHGNCIKTSSLDSPNLAGLTLDEVLAGADGKVVVPGLADSYWLREEAAPTYVVDSNTWKARVLGEFPENAEDATFLLQWLHESAALWPAIEKRLRKREFAESLAATRMMGVDVGEGHGGDETVILVRNRWFIDEIYADRFCDPMKTAAKICELCQKWQVSPRNVRIDAAGPGSGTVPRLKELRVYVESFKGGEAPRDKRRFFNRRTEAYWHLREALQPQHADRFCIGSDLTLRADLLAQRHLTKSDRVIALEEKSKIQARLGRSPDRTDALAMSFAPSTAARVESVPMTRW